MRSLQSVIDAAVSNRRISRDEAQDIADTARANGQVSANEKSQVSKVLASHRRDQFDPGAYEILEPLVAGSTANLASQIPPAWRAVLAGELDKPYFKELERFLVEERARATILPPVDKVFEALRQTPPEKVRVVLLGQDPYPTEGDAMGLSFSVPKGRAIPGSLRNMYSVLQRDEGLTPPGHGDLSAWAQRGVLLLNTVLTVERGAPNSHRRHGWETFTRAILDVVNAKPQRVAFLLLGAQAQREAAHLDAAKHALIKAPHPSPANPGNPFGRSHPFSEVNRALEAAGQPPIDWQLPQ